MPYTYILRYAAEPGFHEQRKLADLVEFCKRARIDDVMFFLNQEELNRGHLTREETAPWLEMIARGKEALDPLGVTTSINPWITLLHCDRGRTLREGQNFHLMVDPNGRRAAAVACPLCPEWRGYISDMYAYYASLHPHMLWVEDDFRLHNHAPLDWGGCFCELHMAEFSRRAGREVSSEEFVRGVLQRGEPHPYRKIWLDCARETMADLARLIGDAVHAVSPSTRVGLMSSVPAIHCAEGRDWAAVLSGFSGADTPMVDRPHLPAYGGTAGQQYLWHFQAISRQSVAIMPSSTELYPELESFPHSRFSKSLKFTRHQMETSLALGARGITFNIFEMAGSGVMLGEGYQDTLAEVKDFLSDVTDLGLTRENETGVKVLFSPDSSYTLHTPGGARMEELYPSETFWASYLTAFGIANTFSSEPEQQDGVVAVSGQYFRNLDARRIRALFDNNFVLMDGDAAATLVDMGLGDLAGIRSVAWHGQDGGTVAYEQVCDGREYCRLPEARMSAQTAVGDYLEVEYLSQPELRTVAKGPAGETIGPGMAVYEGRAFILPYGRACGRYQTLLNPVRQEIIHSVLRERCGDRCPIYVQGAPYVWVCCHDLGSQLALLLTNSSDDDVNLVQLHLPGSSAASATEISRTGRRSVDLACEGDLITIAANLASLETRVLLLGC